MQIIQLHLVRTSGIPLCDDPVDAPDGALLQDILWAHAAAGCGIEHIRARVNDDGIELSFLLSEYLGDPLAEVCRLWGRAASASAYLARWSHGRVG